MKSAVCLLPHVTIAAAELSWLRLAALLRGLLHQTTNRGALLALAGEVQDFGHLQI
jgi:hypothetical protein